MRIPTKTEIAEYAIIAFAFAFLFMCSLLAGTFLYFVVSIFIHVGSWLILLTTTIIAIISTCYILDDGDIHD